MTEHAGGRPALAFESSGPEERSVAVISEDFDYSRLDSAEELLEECYLLHRDPRPTLHAIIERELSVCRRESVAAVILLILDAPNPAAMAMQVQWACGGYISEGISMPQIARQLGITKQAFQQRDRRIHEMLQLRKTRCMRSDESKANMRRACASSKTGGKAKPLFAYNLRSTAMSMTRWLRQQVLALPVKAWTKQRRAAMRLELQGIVEVYSTL